jgi:hypothetical protein
MAAVKEVIALLVEIPTGKIFALFGISTKRTTAVCQIVLLPFELSKIA